MEPGTPGNEKEETMKRRGWIFGLCLAASLTAAGCGGGNGESEDADTVEDDAADPAADDMPGDADGGDADPDLPDDGVEGDPPVDLPAEDGPDPSRVIIVDPDNPGWLKYSDDGSFFMCGPGDPEDFLYRGTRNADGTRSGDQMDIIDKLRGTGANSIYLMAVRSHGGDGDATHNPFVDNDPASGINDAVLDQWETWFAAMDGEGIVIFFFFYDDSARIWDTGDDVGAEERLFLETLVNRFEHHGHLIWAVAEEYQERFSAARVSNMASVIADADDYDHAVAVHKLSGLDFTELADDPHIDQFAIQYNVDTPQELHDGMVTAWEGAAGRYNLNMSEAANYGSGEAARRKSWAVAMGGAYVMALGWDVVSTPLEDLEDCGVLRTFMESTSFAAMEPHDELAYGGTRYVLALPGESYIAYAADPSGDLGIEGMTAGSYDLVWLDILTGTRVEEEGVAVPGGDQSWPAPDGMGSEIALFISRIP